MEALLHHQAAPATPTATPTATPVRMKAPGTCGELMQGGIDEQDFLVNCPIDLYAYATVHNDAGKRGLYLDDLHRYTKIRDTLELAAAEFAIRLSHRVAIRSDIPRGKGMASSSADISAALEGLCRSSRLRLNQDLFARLVTEIEPSDCVHFDGIAHVNHLTGRLYDSMPAPQGMSVLIVDCGGEIDTIGFDRKKARALYRQNQPYLKEALATLKRGLRENDLPAVARAATASAALNQQIHYKPQFDELLAASRELGALGVNCAHSGTVLGVMYATCERLRERLIREVEQRFGATTPIVGNYTIIAGGCRDA
jgi:L-threonine kinase